MSRRKDIPCGLFYWLSGVPFLWFCSFVPEICRKFAQLMEEDNYVYSEKVLGFVAVCVEYCKCLEQCREAEREAFVDTMRGILPMLYLKVPSLKDVPDCPGFNEPHVTEGDYDFVRSSVASVMGDRDDYLEVFVEDFKYSDQPVLRTVSEGLADIYQVLRDFVEVFREGFEEAMKVGLHDVAEQFELSWGQVLLNTLKALHDSRFGGTGYGD